MADKVTSYDLSALQSALTNKDEGVIQQLHAKHLLQLESSLQQRYPQLDIVPTDRVAEKLLPNAALNYRPLSTPADGNCFFNAVSIALVGSTALAETLRLLTAIEIGKADNNYFLHPIIETAMSLPCVHQRETHMSLLTSDDEVEHTRHENGDMEALQQLAIKTSTDSYWAGFIHFLAVSNVTGYNIKSFYPQTDCLCEPMKLLLNSSVPPSTDNSCGQINIMWSNVNGGISEQAMFVPNHFVPLSEEVFFYSDDDLYDDKTLAILDRVIIPSLVTTASEWETDNVPLKKLKCLSVPKAPAEVENTLNVEEKVASEDSLSDLESFSSEGCDSESTSGDEGDDEDDIKTSVDGIINWFEPFRKIIKKPFYGEKSGPTVNLEQETSELNLLMSFLGEHFLDTTASVSNQYVQMYKMKTSHLTAKDIAVYIGLRIVMGVDPKSAIDDYWSTDACLVNKFVSTTISKNLFKDIHRAFHVDDPRNTAQTSALDRVNSLLSNMKTKSKEFFNLHENISIDEAMIKFH
ncbi:PiggyBac transposable element-derived protein 4-like [Plakobranchus ocellatus]|uniref:PiggyBac transposable element-derived protein 4-like n=1 Tax=Plakobranchus ocellatus TaxID=259542 RepID=A0AAV4BCZ3_9GAST|nr:PiggyBac transposable element-derived protein 4-like [Plakobranchus ocellatus]